ncbi:MAG TPA: hypothetical protein VNO79_16645, partial [Actinomycetota bacterium]|nr:hypothetical protein [Actinomycetota bacterium]
MIALNRSRGPTGRALRRREGATGRRGDDPRWRRLGAGILGGLAGAVAVAAAATVVPLADRSAPREPGPAPSAAVTVTDFPLGGENYALDHGFGSVWVAGYDPGDAYLPGSAYLLQVDPGTGEVVARIAASATAWEQGGDGLAVGHGSVWAVGGALQRIDPSTGVVHVIDELDGVAVAVAERDLWVAVMDHHQPLAPAEVIRLDPGTGEVVARV